jgi:iron complex transport system substrate-binding protein
MKVPLRNRRSRVRAPQAALVMLLLSSAAAHAQNSSPRTASALFAEVTDEAGRRVRIPQQVQRIVSLAPSLTETVYALGAEDRLVGDTDFCDYPAGAQNKPKVGGAVNPSLEQVVALRPDLVLVTRSLNRLETVRALEQLNIPAYATDPHTVADVLSSVARLSEVLGIGERGRALSQTLEGRLMNLQSRLAATAPRRVLFVVWAEPLISVGQKTFIADALRLAGAVSVVESTQDWPQVNLEEAVRSHPEYLIFADSHSETGARDFEALAERPGWRDLDAVRNRRIALISDAVNRPAPRLISAIEDLARQLHPDAFSENEKARPDQPAPTKPRASLAAGEAWNIPRMGMPPGPGPCACAH